MALGTGLRESKLSLRLGQEIGYFFSIDPSEVPQLDDVYAALAGLAFRDI
jgi:hypothetical protein